MGCTVDPEEVASGEVETTERRRCESVAALMRQQICRNAEDGEGEATERVRAEGV